MAGFRGTVGDAADEASGATPSLAAPSTASPGAPAGKPLVGVLALQGGFEAHARMLRGMGTEVREVRVPADLAGLQGLVIPGGESTTMTLGIAREGLAEPLRELIAPGAAGIPPGTDGAAGSRPGVDGAAGIPVLGSCAGLIMLDREHLRLMDMRAQRNAFGRQIASFEADVRMRGIDGPPLRGVFIRAPWIAEHGPRVEILAEVDGHPVAARQGDVIAVAFHAELTGDDRVHRLLLDAIAQRRASA
jgi:5'-phosphate synthase pdxT subunit